MIRVFLLADTSTELLTGQIIDFLVPFFESTAEFRRMEAVIPHRHYWTWKDLFAAVRESTDAGQAGNGSVYSLFMVGGANEQNWFASYDPNDPSVGFVQCSGWDQFDLPDPTYPVAYHVLAMVTAMRYFPFIPAEDRYHHRSIGCMFDYTINKSEVLFKLKSSEICMDCVQKIADSAQDSTDALAYLTATQTSLKAIKEHLFPADWREIFGVSAYEFCIDGDLNFRIRSRNVEHFLPILNGYEKVLYLMLLKYREGLSYRQLMEDDKIEEFVNAYFNFFARLGNREELSNRLQEERAGPELKKRLMTLKSRMNRKIANLLKNYPGIREQVSIRNQESALVVPMERAALKVSHEHVNTYIFS